MRFRPKLTVPLSLMVLLSACTPAGEEPEPAVEEAPTAEADVDAINDVLEREVATANAGDVEGFIAIAADDAVWMPPNEPAVLGKEALRSWSQDFVDQFEIQYTASSEETVVVGDWAFQRATITLTLTPKAGGEPIQLDGKGIHIYQRQPDGSWKIARDIWNSDNPPPSTGQ